MINVGVCNGRETYRDVPPDRIDAFLRPPAAPPQARGRGAQGAPPGGNGHEPGGKPGAGGVRGAGASVMWVDVASPTEGDWAMLTEQFPFHPLAVEDAQKQNQRAKLDAYEGYLFLSARAWAGSTKPTDDAEDATREIDVFLGPNYLVTVHEGGSEPINETRRRWEKSPELMNRHPAFLLYLLLDAIVDDYFPAMDELDAEIDKVETAIYGTDPAAATDLKPALALKKRLLLLRQAVAPLRDVLNQMLRTDDHALLPSELHVYFQDVYDHTLRLVEQIDLHRDILTGVMDAMMAQVNNRLNQVMKTLTGISTILMSVTLVASIYGMNFKHMPELETRYGYFGALSAMIVIAVVLTTYFKRIKWF